MQQLKDKQQSYNYAYKTLYDYMRNDLGLKAAGFSHSNLYYAKVIILKNLNDYIIFRQSNKAKFEHPSIPEQFKKELDDFEFKMTEMSNEMEEINKVKRFPEANTVKDDTPKIMTLIEKWKLAYETAGIKSPQLHDMMSKHFKEFFDFIKIDDAAVIDNLTNDLAIYTKRLLSKSEVANLKVESNDLTESVAKFAKNFTYRM